MILQDASDAGFPVNKCDELRRIVSQHEDFFRTSFSSDPSAKNPPLKIDLFLDACPACVHLRSYSLNQLNFLSKLEGQWNVGCSLTRYKRQVVGEGACLPTYYLEVTRDGGIVY